MVSFPPESPESPDDAGLAPVTYLRPARTASEAERADHPSSTRAKTVRPVVAFPAERQAAETESAERQRAETGSAELGSGGRAQAAGSSPADRRRAAEEKQAARASNVSIHQLARRGMSRWELEQVLAKREIEPETAAAELDRLESVGLLDDAALAVSLVYTQHSRKGLGRTAIEQELRRRHIAPEIIESALAEIADDEELSRATELAVKRVAQLATYDDETARRRLHGFLARKGYSSDVVRQAMDAAFATRSRRGVRFQ